MKILFVCTGNTCRSCMAEAIAKDLIKDYQNDFEFSSAGIYAVMGQSASSNAVNIMEENGIDLSCHISTPLSAEIIENADLILTMTTNHRELLLSHYGEAIGKCYTLLNYIGSQGDIEDPFGGDVGIYRDCANILKLSIEKLLLILKES